MAMSYASAIVGPDGNVVNSHNVASCKRVGTGSYLVTYKTMFASSPGVVATGWNGPAFCGVNIDATNTCQVLTRDKGGNSVDSGFSFVAIGEV